MGGASRRALIKYRAAYSQATKINLSLHYVSSSAGASAERSTSFFFLFLFKIKIKGLACVSSAIKAQKVRSCWGLDFVSKVSKLSLPPKTYATQGGEGGGERG